MSDKLTILCVRFGNKYGREYVERLRNMVQRHTTVPYEFVCLTDDQHPIDGVKNIVEPHAGYVKAWWHKVHMFKSTLPITGRILYFDLDVVIHDKIDKLISGLQPEDFYGILDFNRQFVPNWNRLNSSVMSWHAGMQNEIWDKFSRDPQTAMKLHGDQDWIWKVGQNKIKFWPRDYILSYKWEIRNKSEVVVKNGRRLFNMSKEVIPPPDCCVTVFHGDPKPQDVQDKFVVDNWR